MRGFLKYGWADLPTAMTDISTSFSGMPSIDFTFAVSRMPIMRVSHPWFLRRLRVFVEVVAAVGKTIYVLEKNWNEA